MLKGFSFFIIFLFLAAELFAIPPSPWEIDGLIGRRAPAFVLKSVDGKDVSIASFRKKVVLLNF